MPTRKAKPWRGFPSINAVHGIRARVKFNAPNPAQGEFSMTTGAANAQMIGTIPAGAIITRVFRRVEVAAGAGAVLALGTTAGGVDIVADLAPTAVAAGDVALVAGAGTNMPTADRVLWLTHTGTQATVGTVDVLVEFYVNKD